jgi:hypothetical protein
MILEGCFWITSFVTVTCCQSISHFFHYIPRTHALLINYECIFIFAAEIKLSKWRRHSNGKWDCGPAAYMRNSSRAHWFFARYIILFDVCAHRFLWTIMAPTLCAPPKEIDSAVRARIQYNIFFLEAAHLIVTLPSVCSRGAAIILVLLFALHKRGKK